MKQKSDLRVRLFSRGNMIITGGIYRGQKIETLKNNDVRPTSSKVRQSLFNMIFSLGHGGGSFLDLFSGSGIMGIEAMSRGFEKSIFIEKNPSTARLIEGNLRKLKISSKPVVTDAIRFLENTNEHFDVIFADPPYAKEELFHEVLRIVSSRRLLTEDGLLIVEKPVALKLYAEDRYEVLKDKTYGTTGLVVLSVRKEENHSETDSFVSCR